MPESQNTVKIIDGKYIEIRFIGDQTPESVKKVADEAMAATQEFINKDEWVRVLVDITKQGKTTSESRKTSKEAYNYGTYDKLVVIGFNPFMKKFINSVIRASGRQSSARLENSRKKAIAWLLEDPEQLKI